MAILVCENVYYAFGYSLHNSHDACIPFLRWSLTICLFFITGFFMFVENFRVLKFTFLGFTGSWEENICDRIIYCLPCH